MPDDQNNQNPTGGVPGQPMAPADQGGAPAQVPPMDQSAQVNPDTSAPAVMPEMTTPATTEEVKAPEPTMTPDATNMATGQAPTTTVAGAPMVDDPNKQPQQ